MNQTTQTVDHVSKMDRIYYYQRFFYDMTRKFYLFGRDTVIRETQLQPGNTFVEIGCGTARNLVMLAKRHPECTFYGIDASTEMLKTADIKIKKHNLQDRIILKHGLAEELDHRSWFGLEQPFDAAMFSYSLSMIPTWEQAIQAALQNLKSGGQIYIVDFWDQADLPRWFQVLLKQWLALFHVRHEPELLNYLGQLDQIDREQYHVHSIFGRYSLKTTIQKT